MTIQFYSFAVMDIAKLVIVVWEVGAQALKWLNNYTRIINDVKGERRERER